MPAIGKFPCLSSDAILTCAGARFKVNWGSRYRCQTCAYICRNRLQQTFCGSEKKSAAGLACQGDREEHQGWTLSLGRSCH